MMKPIIKKKKKANLVQNARRMEIATVQSGGPRQHMLQRLQVPWIRSHKKKIKKRSHKSSSVYKRKPVFQEVVISDR